MNFITNTKNQKLLIEYAQKHYSDIPSDEWYMEVLYHIDDDPQVTLVHTYSAKERLELVYPVYNEETRKPELFITDVNGIHSFVILEETMPIYKNKTEKELR